MTDTETIDPSDWDRFDLDAIAAHDDKLRECEFFFDLLSVETNVSKFRWFTSAFLNAAYSYFESTALSIHFRFVHPTTMEYLIDTEGLKILKDNVNVEVPDPKKPKYVKTSGSSQLTKKLYDYRKQSTHYCSLSILTTGTSLPEDFHFGHLQDQGVPVMPFIREVISLLRSVHIGINN
jgi:hypothetical protein